MGLSIRELDVSVSGRRLLRGVTLDLADGELGIVAGPSGSGKSTLLRAIVGFESVDRGDVSLDGRPPASFGYPAFRRVVHLVPQRPVLTGDTVGAALERPFRFRAAPPAPTPAAFEAGCRALDLAPSLLAQRPETLSGGELHRFALLRGALLKPRALLLDEPTSALDPERTAALSRWLDDLRAGGVMILVATHAPTPAERAAGRVVELRAEVSP